jgi:predicted RNA-binding Zn ribbon-like protein
MVQPGGRAPAPRELRLAQDLANTVDIEMRRDRLTTVADLRRFALDHGIKSTFGKDDLARVRRFREALREVCAAHAGRDVPPATRDEINRLLARAPIVVSLGAAGDAGFGPPAGIRGADAVLAHLAAAITEAVVRGSWRRLKACEAHECRWVYYDRSRAGHGRWCTMKICGARAKVRAYRARARQS